MWEGVRRVAFVDQYAEYSSEFEIDLSPYENVTSVTVSKPYQNVLYVALLPAVISFEAISYNLDGTVFCKIRPERTRGVERVRYGGKD